MTMTYKEAFEILAEYMLYGTVDKRGVKVQFYATPEQFDDAMDLALSAILNQIKTDGRDMT